MRAFFWTYLLRDPRDQKIRYIGRTGNAVHKRIAQHILNLNTSKGCKELAWWLSDLCEQRLWPEYTIIRGDRETELLMCFAALEAELLNVQIYKRACRSNGERLLPSREQSLRTLADNGISFQDLHVL